ncbi:hypothetical protein PAMP_000916 [Pampus punctatissimus]
MTVRGGWLRNRGTTPSSPLGSPARSLLYAVLVPSDPGSLVCPMSREKGEEVEWEREQQIERDTDKERELEEVWATVQPIWDVLHRQPVPEVTDKADLIFVECLKVPLSHNLASKSLCDLVIHIYNPSWTLCSSDRGPPATLHTRLLSVGKSFSAAVPPLIGVLGHVGVVWCGVGGGGGCDSRQQQKAEPLELPDLLPSCIRHHLHHYSRYYSRAAVWDAFA